MDDDGDPVKGAKVSAHYSGFQHHSGYTGEDGWVEFDHLDGMYSYCVAYDGEGNSLGVCHLKAWTPLKACGTGYEIDWDAPEGATLEEMDALWNEAKAQEA